MQSHSFIRFFPHPSLRFAAHNGEEHAFSRHQARPRGSAGFRSSPAAGPKLPPVPSPSLNRTGARPPARVPRRTGGPSAGWGGGADILRQPLSCPAPLPAAHLPARRAPARSPRRCRRARSSGRNGTGPRRARGRRSRSSRRRRLRLPAAARRAHGAPPPIPGGGHRALAAGAGRLRRAPSGGSDPTVS